MKTRLVRIRNSRGIRLPKPLIEQAGLVEEVELKVEEGMVIPVAGAAPRAGWAEAAKLMRKRREDGLLDPQPPTLFDETEWEW